MPDFQVKKQSKQYDAIIAKRIFPEINVRNVKILIEYKRAHHLCALDSKAHIRHGNPAFYISLMACNDKCVQLCLINLSIVIKAPCLEKTLNHIISESQFSIHIIHLYCNWV